ncbi:MAG: hypothetical protein ACKV19_02145 [Verrucomicrobiales bacterium]
MTDSPTGRELDGILYSGSRLGGDPSIGGRVNRGLGTLTQDLPGFILPLKVSYTTASRDVCA